MDHNMKKPCKRRRTLHWPADDIKRLPERDAADAFGLTLYELMLRAGSAAFQVTVTVILTPDTGWCCVVNNGGDGYVIGATGKSGRH